jgi:4-amino-4-deoxy-L-arabinose transferase-like glycosyltransferase
MAIILIPAAFLLIFVSLRISGSGFDHRGGAFIPAVLLLSTLVVISTEVLSVFHFYCYQGLTCFWGLIDIVLFFPVAWHFKHYKKERFTVPFLPMIKRMDGTSKIVWLGLILLLSAIFIQGLIYPPNNWDSMTYHMARIVHWTQNRSVEHYPAIFLPQLYQPPFAEYFISQICILTGSDVFANSVQWFFLVSTLFVIRNISRELGMDEKQQLLVVILALTIPEAVLQGSSTQNDLVVAFFISCAFYYSMISLRSFSFYSCSFLGISAALSILTKATAYLFLTPVLMISGAISMYQIISQKKWKLATGYLLIITIIFMMNVGFYYRNYQFTHSIFGVTGREASMYKNDLHTIPVLISNISRNTALHFGVPGFSNLAENLTVKLHHWLGLAPNDARTTFDYVRDFHITPYGTHEDFGANIIHVVLMIISTLLFILYFRRMRREMLIYVLAVLSQFLLFCFYLKWQPWNSRLHTPLFILFTPVLAFFLAYTLPVKLRYFIVSLLYVYAVLVCLFNYSRPIITLQKYTAAISVRDDRFKKYFSNKMSAYNEFRMISIRMKNHGDRSVGIEFGGDEWEYPLFRDIFNHPIRSLPLDIQNESRLIRWSEEIPDCIVSTKKRDILEFHAVNYYNFTPYNSTIYYYRAAGHQ